MTKITLIGLLFISTLTNVFAQASQKEITDKFFELYSKDPLKAVDYAFSTNKWFDRQQDGVANLKNKLKNLVDLCGEYYGFEVLSDRSAGQSVRMITYIIKYDREPIRFSFLLYKPKDKWQVNNLSFDEDIDNDLSEATKAYRLKENY
jgi:hypothetical protein